MAAEIAVCRLYFSWASYTTYCFLLQYANEVLIAATHESSSAILILHAYMCILPDEFTLRASFAMMSSGVVDAFEALSGDAVAVADGVAVIIAVAVAGSANASTLADLFHVTSTQITEISV